LEHVEFDDQGALPRGPKKRQRQGKRSIGRGNAMSKSKRRPRPNKVDRLLAKELARQTCNDCGVNVIEIGAYYMLNPDVWERQLGLGWTDNLCVGSVRYVRLSPLSVDAPASDRMADQLGFERDRRGNWRTSAQPKGRTRRGDLLLSPCAKLFKR
jgi:hypothetical protein